MKLLSCLIALAACQTTPSWQVTRVEAGNSCHDLARLSAPIHDRVNGIGVEIVRIQDKIVTYLEVHAHVIPPYQDDPSKAQVILKTGGKTLQGVGRRHRGGQRITLSESLQEILIESLKHMTPVTILLEGYSTTLDASSFSEYYEALTSKTFKLPIKFYG